MQFYLHGRQKKCRTFLNSLYFWSVIWKCKNRPVPTFLSPMLSNVSVIFESETRCIPIMYRYTYTFYFYNDLFYYHLVLKFAVTYTYFSIKIKNSKLRKYFRLNFHPIFLGICKFLHNMQIWEMVLHLRSFQDTFLHEICALLYVYILI